MAESEFEQFLLTVASEVDRLVAYKKVKEQFQHHIKLFGKMRAARDKEETKYRENARKCSQLRDKKAGRPEPGWIWENSVSTPAIPDGYWRPPESKLPPDPVLWLQPGVDVDPERPVASLAAERQRAPNSEEKLTCSYVVLALIHDEKAELLTYEPIFGAPKEHDPIPWWDSWLGRLAQAWCYPVWQHQDLTTVARAFIEDCLDRVKADLAPVHTAALQAPRSWDVKASCQLNKDGNVVEGWRVESAALQAPTKLPWAAGCCLLILAAEAKRTRKEKDRPYVPQRDFQKPRERWKKFACQKPSREIPKLEEALKPLSVIEHVRHLGYRLSPGISADTSESASDTKGRWRITVSLNYSQYKSGSPTKGLA